RPRTAVGRRAGVGRLRHPAELRMPCGGVRELQMTHVTGAEWRISEDTDQPDRRFAWRRPASSPMERRPPPAPTLMTQEDVCRGGDDLSQGCRQPANDTCRT